MPTAAESGVLPGYEAYSWVGLLAPAGTPAPVVVRLNAECRAFLADLPVRAAMEAQGMIADPTTPEAFGTFIREEVVKWGAVVRAAGVRLK